MEDDTKATGVSHTKMQFFKYIVAGGLAFTSEYGSFYIFLEVLGLQLYVANSLSFCVGLAVSFTMNRMWTFKGGGYRLGRTQQLLSYLALALTNLMLINIWLGVLKHYDLNPLIGKIVVMLAVVVWNFFIFRLAIFSKKQA